MRYLLLIILIGAAGAATGCHESHGPPAPSEPLATARVRTLMVDARGFDAYEQVVGTVRAKVRATLEAKVSGRILKMPVAVGDRVRKGQVVAQLDAQEIKANLTKARAVLRQAKADLDRYTRLLQQKSVTPAEFEAVQAKHAVAAATVNEAETLFSYARVTAPFDGVVTHKLADVGDLASPGRPLVEIDDPGTLRLEAAVPEALSGFVGLGTPISVRLSSLEKTVDGIVSEVAPTADPNSRTLLVKIDLETVKGLRAGQFGRALVPTGRTNIVRVPTDAVVRRGQLEILFIAVDSRAQLRLVKTGKVFGEQVEIVSGLEPGEAVIVTKPSSLRDGQPIEVEVES